MEVKLIGALDYKKVEKVLKKRINDEKELKKTLKELRKIEIAGRTEKVATAGRLSRFAGNILEILEISEEKSLEQNTKYASMVTKMGHNSIADHDYCVFALKDVSPVIEQSIIAERYSSFTIKSRREVDFSKVGFYTPDFHSKDGKILPNNKKIKSEYRKHMKSLFKDYSILVSKGIKIEDARFVLPYSYHSNIIMGVDAHTLKDMIIKYTKTKYANIQELKELGDKLLEIARKNIPYIIDEIEEKEVTVTDSVDEYINKIIPQEKYKILSKTELLNYSGDIDDTIITTAIMRRYQYNRQKALEVYKEACKTDPEFSQKMMQKIAFESDGLELSQVNFQFQIPLSYAVLTHLTRHRAHDIIVPDFAPVPDLTQYKVAPSIEKICKDEYHNIFSRNIEMYNKFKSEYKVREEDLVYFVLSGNMTNCMTNINGKYLKHIVGLRACNKTQWETRKMAKDIMEIISNLEDAKYYSTVLGASCDTQGVCNEGKECCGRVYNLKNCKMPKKELKSIKTNIDKN